MEENWKSIPEYEDFYQASTSGRVRRIQYGTQGRRADFLKPQKNPKTGYMSVSLSAEGTHKRFNLHSLIARTFLGEILPGMEINHKDGDKANNAVTNLEYVTHSYNNRHSYRVLGRKSAPSYGERHGNHKLTQVQVNDIRDAYRAKPNYAEIARQYQVHWTTIRSIVRNQTWKDGKNVVLE